MVTFYPKNFWEAPLVVDPEGNVLAELGEDTLDNASLADIEVGPDGNIYVATWDGWIGVMDIDGNLLAQWGTEGDGEGSMAYGEFYIPNGIAVDAEGNVYVSEDTDEYAYITKFFFPELQ